MTRHYRIERDDGQRDQIAGQCFSSYDEAYAVLERYYADLLLRRSRVLPDRGDRPRLAFRSLTSC